jgi:hypothetical protein
MNRGTRFLAARGVRNILIFWMLEQGSFVGEIADNSAGYMADGSSDMEKKAHRRSGNVSPWRRSLSLRRDL